MNNILLLLIIIFLTTSISAQKQEAQLSELVTCEEVKLGCLILGRGIIGKHIIQNDIEYQKLQEHRTPTSECDNHTPPIIDFNSYTLLGYVAGIAGCGTPQVSHEIIEDNNEYNFNINIIQDGRCKRNNTIVIWCKIPKTDSNSTYKFNIINTIKK